MSKTIDRRAMDAFLHGVSSSLGYLGDQRRAILDKMGDLMLEYLIEAGKVKSPARPKEFAQSLTKLLTKNGFGPRIPLRFKGSPPTPTVSNFVDYLMPNRSRRARRRKVDWVLFEMALYSMTKVLDDQLGAQAQLMLDRIGTEMLNYLVEIRAIEPSDDSDKYFQRVIDFFMRAGYAGSVELKWEGSPPHTIAATYKYARYYTTVLGRLRNEGSILFSCPMCLAGQSILARAQGLRFQNVVEFQILPAGKVFFRTKIYPPTERFTEEDAQKISQMTA